MKTQNPFPISDPQELLLCSLFSLFFYSVCYFRSSLSYRFISSFYLTGHLQYLFPRRLTLQNRLIFSLGRSSLFSFSGLSTTSDVRVAGHWNFYPTQLTFFLLTLVRKARRFSWQYHKSQVVVCGQQQSK